MKRKPIVAFIICYLSYLSIYIARLNLSMAAPELKDAAILNAVQIGMLGSVFSTVYAVGRLLSGWISDRVSPWVVISGGLLFTGLSNLAIGFFPPYAGIVILWGSNALAQSLLWGPILRVVSAVYDEQTAKKRASFMATAVAGGNILGILLNNTVIQYLDVGWAFLFPGALTLVMCALTAWNLRGILPTGGQSQPIGFRSLVKQSELRKMAVPAVLHGVMKDNISLWMTVYIMDQFGVQLGESALYVLLIPVVGLLGRMSYPFWYKCCKEQEQRVAVYAFLICGIGSLAILFAGSALFAVICLSLIYAAVSVINTSFLTIYPMRFARSGNVASVSGVMDFCTYLGTGLSAVIYGAVIDGFGYDAMYGSWAVLTVPAAWMLVKILKEKQQRKQQ